MNTTADVEKYQQYLDKDISTRQQALSQYTKFQTDYHQLQRTLRDLPTETRYSAMIPAGPLAFFPGTLVHTNEILVLLGDNYFVERSATQAAMIAKRREEFVIKKIKESEKELRELKRRQKMGVVDEELDQAQFNEDGERFVDIKEEVTEEHLRTAPWIEEIVDERQAGVLKGVRERAMEQDVVMDRKKLGRDERQLMELLDQFGSDDDEHEEDDEEEEDQERDEEEDGDAFSDEDRMNAVQDDDDDDFNEPIRPAVRANSDDEDDDDFSMNIVERFSGPLPHSEPASHNKGILKASATDKAMQKGKSVKFDSTVVAHVASNTELLEISDSEQEKDQEAKMANLMSALQLSGCGNTSQKPKIQVIGEEKPTKQVVSTRDSGNRRPVKSAIVERPEVSEVTADMVDEDMHAKEISQAYARMRFGKMSAGKLDGAAGIAEKVLAETPGVRFADRKKTVEGAAAGDEDEMERRIELPGDAVPVVERDPKPPVVVHQERPATAKKMSRFKARRMGMEQ